VKALQAATRERKCLGLRAVSLLHQGKKLQVKGLIASQVIRLIGLLLVFVNQKTVHNFRNEMAESIVPLRKKSKDSLTRQGMWNMRGLHRKGLAERKEKVRVLSSERAHKQVLTVKKNMHLILNSLLSSTGSLVTVAITTAPDGGFHHESMCSQAKPAHIPHYMLREIKVQIARRHQGATPIPCPSA